ncbi:Bifunctional oligoribonuclease and PAP phosphatase NrnA [Thermotalea metallivorans]|uniref:Bifunctional oligoribonuclease and PAP phosphatase NrnA n=2 Tax=Thermotalea metallivorans TaxID=520762 RepID=A0A140L5H2_9FIRM|nr:Bifunctional oligoribonuclease and PAP phosphatase NrnA [Thermotalea metallivorans]
MEGKMMSKEKIYQEIERGEHIFILPHVLPDGDTIGSSLALFLALKKVGKKPYVLLSDDIPYHLTFLPIGDIQREIAETITPDLVIAVDCSDMERLGSRRKYIEQASISLNIDHHITNTRFASVNWVDDEAAATGEMIYTLIKDMGISLDQEIATCLYAAITTDTGSFKYSNTTPKTHRIAAELLASGIPLNGITTEIYQNKPAYQVKLLSVVLNTLEFCYSGKLALLHVTQDMLDGTGAKVSDTDGLIEYARDIKGVEVGVLLKELEPGEIKVGFRSKYNIDVSKVAGQFGGGGHTKASGCTIKGDMKNVKEAVVNAFKNIL